MYFLLVRLYALIHEFCHEYLSFNPPGLGFLMRRLKSDRTLYVKNKQMHFDARISDNYGNLLNGNFNEKETHIVLDRIFANTTISNFHFVDIGGNVGEFVIDYAANVNVKKVTVFEPQPIQQSAIEKTIKLNDFKHVNLIKNPVSHKEELVIFNFNATNSTASGIVQNGDGGVELMATTIDSTFGSNFAETYVFLIDTEGAELSIMKGGHSLIKTSEPIIIFEYNFVTKQYFHVNDVQTFLGKNYKIFRINKKGEFDNDLENAWNLIAIPLNSKFNYMF